MLVHAILALGFVFRLVLAAVVPPGYDEAYYLFYGQHLDLSFFDHPTAVGLWSWLGQGLGYTPLALRYPSVLSYTVALWLLGDATGRWFGPHARLWSVLLGSFCPVVFICAGVLLLPDAPLVLALAFLLSWLSRHPRVVPASPREALQLGVILAAITLSKYHALLLLPALLTWTLAHPAIRRGWQRPWPWLSVLVWAVGSSPLWLWNLHHGWISLLFQGGRTVQGQAFAPDGSLLFLLSQIGLLFPTIGLVLVLSLCISPVGPARHAQTVGLLRWLVCTQLLAFVLLAGRMQVMASWLVPAWWLLMPLAANWLARWSWESRSLRASGFGTALILPPLLLLAAGQTRWGWLESLLPTRRDPSAELMTPGDLSRSLQARPEIWHALQKAEVIASHRYEIPGFLALALGSSTGARFTTFSNDPRGFAFWDPVGGFRGASGVIVAPVEPAAPLHKRSFPGVVANLEPLGVVQVQRAGRPSVQLEFVRFGPLTGPYPRPYGPTGRD